MSLESRNREDAAPLVVATVIGVIVAIAALHGFVHNLGTAGSLSSTLALPVMVAIFYAARRLRDRVLRARKVELRKEDQRNRDHMVTTINICRSLALGAEGSDSRSTATMSAMRYIAHHVGNARTTHEHLLTPEGKQLAEKVIVMALSAISGHSCAPADLTSVLHSLRQLNDKILDVDSRDLLKRREQAAMAEDSY